MILRNRYDRHGMTNENNLNEKNDNKCGDKNEMTSRDRYDITLRKITSRDVTKIRSNVTDVGWYNTT